jgi:hypothetical protein
MPSCRCQPHPCHSPGRPTFEKRADCAFACSRPRCAGKSGRQRPSRLLSKGTPPCASLPQRPRCLLAAPGPRPNGSRSCCARRRSVAPSFWPRPCSRRLGRTARRPTPPSRCASSRSARKPCTSTCRWALGPATAAGDLLLRRRPRAQTRVRRRGPARPPPRRSAHPRRRRRHGRPRTDLRRDQPGRPAGALRGWAIPTATVIAFALAVLAVIGPHLPTALRTILLTLAVVDDLLAVTIIAIFYPRDLQSLPQLGALATLALSTVAVQRRMRPPGSPARTSTKT